MADAPQFDGKEYHLKRTETEMLIQIKTHLDAVYSIALSHIAAERLGYPVSENTLFQIAPDFTKIVIAERAAESENSPETGVNDPIPQA